MKKISLAILILSASAYGKLDSPTMIYGEDNRTDTYKHSSYVLKNVAHSSAAMISSDKIRLVAGNAELRGKSIGEIYRLCKGSKFSHQPMIAECSGFLVAPDIIVTAGHCYQGSSCGDGRWVFDYKVEDSKQRNVTVSEKDIYKCKEVIKQSLTKDSDFAVIRLDRKVEGRVPLKIAKSQAKLGDKVAMVGHPSGLPQKITDGAVVTAVSPYEFKASLDAFQINSGSAVVNEATGEVLGILVRGGRDYEYNEMEECSGTYVEPKVKKGKGEDVSSFSQFIRFIK